MTTEPKPDTKTILDHEDKIAVPGDVFREPANEYWAMLCLWQGMEFLFAQASKCTDIVKQCVNPEGNKRVSIAVNIPGLVVPTQQLLTCAFHWYAVSACNYARLVGAIAYRQDNKRPIPPEYIENVMPEVLAFRDKVAAHFAWSTKNSKDKDAERAFSVFPPLSFDNDAFHVGGSTLMMTRSGKPSSSEAIKPWSIVEVHKRLRKPYWPTPEDGAIGE